MARKKNPLIALILSLVVPGLGQIYNAEFTKGLVLAAGCLVIGMSFFWLSALAGLSALLALIILWVSAFLDAYVTARAGGEPLDWYYRVSYVVAMLLLVGPVALPLLWKSPHFSRAAKSTWTTVVIVAVLLFVATPYLLSWLMRQMPDLAGLLQRSGLHSWGPRPNLNWR